MPDRLTPEDIDVILEALEYRRKAHAEARHDGLPDAHALRRQHLARVEPVLEKVRLLRRAHEL